MLRLVIVCLMVLLVGCATRNTGLDAQTNASFTWLGQKQNENGSWGTNSELRPALTGAALMAYFSHGETPLSQNFGAVIQKGIQQSNKLFKPGAHRSVEDLVLVSAICESYAITQIPFLGKKAEAALNHLLARRFVLNTWYIVALKAAQHAFPENTELQKRIDQLVLLASTAMIKKMDRGPLIFHNSVLTQLAKLPPHTRAEACFPEEPSKDVNMLFALSQMSTRMPKRRQEVIRAYNALPEPEDGDAAIWQRALGLLIQAPIE